MVEDRKVPEGYKMSEIGVIPENWDVYEIQDAYEICNNLRFPISETIRKGMQGKYPYYGPTRIQDYINEYRLEGQYALIGEDGDHFLKWITMPMTLLATGRFNVNNHAHVVKGKKNETKWFYWYFNHRDITSYLTRQGAGRYKLNKATLKTIKIAIPPLPEQQAISVALSDVDNLIASLEKLIDKKRRIKQGTMQELLTSRRRLPRITGEWTEMRLENLGIMCAGGTPSTFNPQYWNGNIKWLQSGLVQNCYIDKSLVDKFITQKGLEESSAHLIRENSVLIAITGATCANIGFLSFEATANQSVVSIECNAMFDSKFIYYLLLMYRNCILNLKSGSAQGGVTLGSLKKMCVKLPDNKQEQSEIATILSNMDTEIESLEKKLDKYKSIKQGMMQELLTGRIRLV